MGVEIEHKWLIKDDTLSTLLKEDIIVIRQCYISVNEMSIVRIRTATGTKEKQAGYVTIKGQSIGSARLEYESRMSYDEASEIISSPMSLYTPIEKIRYVTMFNGKKWEIDQFLGKNEGLIVAEIELISDYEAYDLPDWVTENVTAEKRYNNLQLSIKPYTEW